MSRQCNKASVHPHACGEHVNMMNNFFFSRGSSPRLWGTPQVRIYPG
ncbi:hypothetical protein D1AOALGA4SA_11464 [Olavius algarvensis Delta 1 endosymbiont]|nr:hypothetical protein D1AOALGA4SA_11464 [Olavius algarvensis Delta 1 endosymbiont]